MRVLVLGAGNVGRAIAYDLTSNFEVWVGDKSEERLENIKEFATPLKVDASDFDELLGVMEKFDLIVDALPGRLGFKAIKAAIEAKRDIVDVSFMPEDPWQLSKEAEKAGVSVVVDAGFAPGLSHILLGRIYQELDKLEEGIIRVGGLPKEPRPPLYYKITWSPYDLIEEYTRKARMIRDGMLVEVDPLEEIGEVVLDHFEFEEFPSDGLRTALRSIKATTLEERTLRWKGHLEKMKLLRELGFFRRENIDFTLRVIAPLMMYEGKDFSIMQVYGRGKREGSIEEIEYIMYDEAREFSSMARVTGFTAAAIVRLAAEKECTVGVVPPELIGMRKDAFEFVIGELKKRGIKFEESRRIVKEV